MINNNDFKKILFLAPEFFNYHVAIKHELEKLGFVVDFISDTLNFPRVKQFFNFFYKYKISHINKLFKSINKNNYDYLFVILGESLTIEFLKKIKAENPNLKLILYQYDSFERYPHIYKNIGYFDRVYTFDLKDYLNYKNDGVKFRPLFFTNDYYNLKNIINHKIDILFVTSLYIDRYTIYKKIKIYIRNNIVINQYFYVSILNYLTKYIFKINIFDIKLIKLSKKKLMNKIINSKAILDIEHPKQNGLTIKTIECIGANKKLITTNKSIYNYTFYNPLQFLIIDRNNPEIDYQFINNNHNLIDQNEKNKYTLENWCKDIFYERNTKFLINTKDFIL